MWLLSTVCQIVVLCLPLLLSVSADLFSFLFRSVLLVRIGDGQARKRLGDEQADFAVGVA